MEQKDYRNMVDELLNLDSGLSNKEIDIIDSMNNWYGNFSPEQGDLIEKIWNRHF
jgi:hypothetical protein